MKKIYRWGWCAVWQQDELVVMQNGHFILKIHLYSCSYPAIFQTRTLFFGKCYLTFKAFIKKIGSGEKHRLWDRNQHANILFWKMGKTSQDAMRIKWGNIWSLECCEYLETIFISLPFFWPFLILYMTSRVFFNCSHTPNPPKPWSKLTSYTKLFFVLI